MLEEWPRGPAVGCLVLELDEIRHLLGSDFSVSESRHSYTAKLLLSAEEMYLF